MVWMIWLLAAGQRNPSFSIIINIHLRNPPHFIPSHLFRKDVHTPRWDAIETIRQAPFFFKLDIM